MKQLVTLFTGGTIGSKKQGTEINVHEKGASGLMEAYKGSEQHREDIILHERQPLNLLSENITPGDWLKLAAAIRELDWSAFEGIIVTHGSDTLAYSAAMLSYLFADIPIPLVLTASNYPLTDARSNGLRNFANAVDFAADAALPGVFVIYENDEGTPLVYLGTRITQAVSFTDQYGSPYNVTYGRMIDRSFQWFEHEQNPQPQALKQQSPSKLNWDPETLRIDDRIVYIRPYPGLNYSFYDFTANKPRAVLHDLHHSGTACATLQGPYSLVAFIRRCREQGIDFYICPIRDRQAALYSSSLKLIEAGALVIENMSIEAALTKLMLAYGLYEESEKAAAFVTEGTLYYERNEV